ncbi:cytochrome bd-I oxidase subunit CydX [Noviherbaspirillum cavernae]|uniref:Cytochrome bd-I oxidase subunit CydX n=1 Tax=Noviherbaspirillum cavernae TaxID=2320862 RepID=A0A418WZF6_9BURK|nr:cytochrome bd-I oxidase subunit CydX [Noviherbaspirillum cavernae]RJG05630.1 cytochrome bd-I oxidase subunit CydX [Noviherbaspirillum cavernae]
MRYFTWVLDIDLALAFGIINVMWLEANYAFAVRDEEQTKQRFEQARQRNTSQRR